MAAVTGKKGSGWLWECLQLGVKEETPAMGIAKASLEGWKGTVPAPLHFFLLPILSGTYQGLRKVAGLDEWQGCWEGDECYKEGFAHEGEASGPKSGSLCQPAVSLGVGGGVVGRSACWSLLPIPAEGG